MAFRILRSSDYRRMRWKNGLGETAEVAIAPEGASLDDFDWRISMARLDAGGPFSAFPGIDRTLSILSGTGLRLATGSASPVELRQDSMPFDFRGDEACESALIDGTVTDLNVMTRRDRCWHQVRRLSTGRLRSIDGVRTLLVVPAAGPARVSINGETVELGPLDALSLGAAPWIGEVSDDGPSGVLLVEIGRC